MCVRNYNYGEVFYKYYLSHYIFFIVFVKFLYSSNYEN